MLYGAMIGDIVGSRFEFDNYKGTDFRLFTDECEITDDTLMTIAVAAAIYHNNDKHRLAAETVEWMQKIGRPYPKVSWGGSFRRWLYSDYPQPYNSFGNGAAMRVSACGWYGTTLSEVIEMTDRVTMVSHDHPEGVKGARAVATAIYTARTTHSKREVFKAVRGYYPILDEALFTVNNIRQTYGFDETCQGTVPQAIEAFLESDNFEDAIRKAVSIGGDSDTVAAITGSIAEACFGVPQWMKDQADYYLDRPLRQMVHTLERSKK